MKRLAIVFISILLCEGLLRLLGFMPYVSTPFALESSPSAFLKTDANLGYALSEGAYHVSINGLSFNTSHSADKQRFVSGIGQKDELPVIALFGCSFTYGFGVDDSLTVASKLQESLYGKANVKSFAVPGYGDVQGYLQLKELIEMGQAPDKVVFGYCAFHNERNVLSANYRIHIEQGLGNNYVKQTHCSFPKCFIENDALLIDFEPASTIYQHWWGRGHLSIINLLQSVYDLLAYPKVTPKETGLLYKEIVSLCNKHDIDIIIAPHDINSGFGAIASYLKNTKYTITNGQIDLSNTEFNNLPFDTHPNAFGYQKMALSIYECILVNP